MSHVRNVPVSRASFQKLLGIGIGLIKRLSRMLPRNSLLAVSK